MPTTTPDLFTTIIAIYGAVLGTLGLILSIIVAIVQFKSQRPYIEVTAEHGKIIDGSGKGSESLIVIRATNKGIGSVMLTGFGWILRDASKRQVIKNLMINFPKQLDERRACTTYRTCKWFQEDPENKKIAAFYYQDETGHIWLGKISRKQRKIWLNAKGNGWQIEWNPKTETYYRPDIGLPL